MEAAYVFAPAESATREAILMAGFGKFKVISIDYSHAARFSVSGCDG